MYAHPIIKIFQWILLILTAPIKAVHVVSNAAKDLDAIPSLIGMGLAAIVFKMSFLDNFPFISTGNMIFNLFVTGFVIIIGMALICFLYKILFCVLTIITAPFARIYNLASKKLFRSRSRARSSTWESQSQESRENKYRSYQQEGYGHRQQTDYGQQGTGYSGQRGYSEYSSPGGHQLSPLDLALKHYQMKMPFTEQQLKRRRNELMKVCHPDNYSGTDPSRIASMEKKSREILSDYKTLLKYATG